MKKPSDLSRLMEYAGGHRAFTYASWVLSALSALMALVPFLYIWLILRDVLAAAPDYSQAVRIPHYGWMAVLFAVLAYLIYVGSLLCSHLSAFRVSTNLRLAVSRHLARLPLGFTAAASCAKLSRRAPARRRPISPTSCRISPAPWPRRWGCWCCCSCLTGGWGC